MVALLTMVAELSQGLVAMAGDSDGRIFSDQFEAVTPVAFSATVQDTIDICAPIDSHLCPANTSVNPP